MAARTAAKGTLIAKPAGVTHVDRIMEAARMILVELAPDADGRLGACARLLQHPVSVQSSGIFAIAWRIAAEFEAPDALTPLIVEGLALELVGGAGRELPPDPRAMHRPGWPVPAT